MASAKRCHYEVLGLQRDCTPDEIRSAYRRLALQRHPDKLVQSGISQAEATTQFQELQHAYEVLSDPKERAWYDSHRSQILFSDPDSVSTSFIPDLFSFFYNTVYSGYSDSGKGFYKVYSDVFDKIHANEINFAKKLGLSIDAVRQAPVMGNLDSPYAQATAFYNYWFKFSTVMDFCWVDQYDVMAGPNRKSRRLMEDENKKLRKKARKEYNDTVRGLAEFVKKRDKRVIDMMVKKNMEMEKKRAEERERKKKLEKEKMERAMTYEEPEWAKVGEDLEDEEDWFEEDGDEKRRKNKEKGFYCVLCGKNFKSEKQWKNHEQSKKHKEKVAEFRDSLGDEEEFVDVEVEGGEGRLESDEDGIGANDDQFRDADFGVDDLEGRLKEGLHVAEEEAANGVDSNDYSEDGVSYADDMEESKVSINFDNNDENNDDEMDVLEAMVAGRRSKKKAASRHDSEASMTKTQIEHENDGTDFMEYDNQKNSRKNRGAKNGRKNREKSPVAPGNSDHQDMNNVDNDYSYTEDCSSQSVIENENNAKVNEEVSRDKKTSNKHAAKKGTIKDTKTKSKGSSKGKKAKATSKNVGNICDACGEEFESRNKLHKHLGDSGHASIKYR